MGFQTNRPKTAQEMISNIKQQQSTIADNQKAILENARFSRESAKTKSVLESVQEQQDGDMETENKLDEMRKKRHKEISMESVTLGKLSLLENAKNMVMDKVLFEMVYDAFWLDKDVKQSTILEAYQEYKNTLALVESTCGNSKTSDSNKSKFIKAVESVVSEVCEKASKRILEEAKETGETDIKFDLTPEDESELDQKLSDLGRDEIVSMVKDKVLSVVQDEKEAGKEKAEMLKEIDDSANDETSDNTNNNAVKEGTTMNSDFTPVEEGISQTIKEFMKNRKDSNKIKTEANELMTSLGTSIHLEKECEIYKKALTARRKKQYDDAIRYLNEYKKEISKLKGQIKSSSKYSKESRNLLLQICDSNIESVDEDIAETKDIKSGVTESHSEEILSPNDDMEPPIMECVSKKFNQRDCARKLVLECGAGSAEAQAVYSAAILESDAAVAIDLFKNYKSILSKSKLKCMIANSDDYSHEVKSCVKEAIRRHQQLCDNEIMKLQNLLESKSRGKDPNELLEQMRLSSVKRSLTNSNGNTLFESMMMKNTAFIRKEAVKEGVDLSDGGDMNAALIESILQYTVLETLNTLQLYKFTNSDIMKLRTNNKAFAMMK